MGISGFYSRIRKSFSVRISKFFLPDPKKLEFSEKNTAFHLTADCKPCQRGGHDGCHNLAAGMLTEHGSNFLARVPSC